MRSNIAEVLNTEVSKHATSPLDYGQIIYWISGNYNSADLRTKYATFNLDDNNVGNEKMINHKNCSPTSTKYIGLPWSKDIKLAIDSNIITSARKINQQEKVGAEGMEIFESGFKKSKIQKLEKGEH